MLIEVLAASVVMVVGVYAILAVFPQALRISRDSGRASALNHLGSQQIEYLRSLDYGHTDLAIGTHPTLQNDSTGQNYYPVSGFPEEHSMRWIVSAGPKDGSGTVEALMKTVIVEATFRVRYDASANPIEIPESLSVAFQTFLVQ